MAAQLSPAQLTAIASEFGTPVYVYHAERIKEQYTQLQDAFKASDTRFFYACKALTNLNVLRYIKSIGCNIDCSSVNEVLLAVQAGFDPKNILYTSNNIAFSEIEAAQQLGVNINIDSLSNLEKFGQKFGHGYPVGIRLRPNIMAGGNLKISTGHEKSKFGIPLEQIDQVLALVKRTNLHIHALHIHTGSEIKDVEVFAKGIEVLFGIAEKFPELQVFDFGGGFKVPYKPGEEGTNMALLGKKVAEEMNWFEEKYNRCMQVWFEPGKFLVSEAGYLITQVNVVKESASTVFAGVDTGLNHFIRPMFYGAYHVMENISNPAGPEKMYNVVGNICETDTFAEDRLLPEVREGDYLVFKNAGAYGFEMASNYNSRFKPAEVLVKDNKAHLIRRRDGLEDLMKNIVTLKD
ncbi:MAG: diaminopimelate decarboxylase [Chitinophagaceae bacterium]